MSHPSKPSKPSPSPSPYELLLQAVGWHQQGQLEAAQALYAKILALQPAHFDALHLSGVIAHQLKKHDQAVTLIQRALKLKPDNAAALCNLGAAQQALKQFPDALHSLNRAIRLQADYADAYYNRATTYRESAQSEQALPDFDKAIALSPQNAMAWIGKGLALRQLKRYDQALAAYDHAIALQPMHPDAYVNRAIVHQDQGDNANALLDFGHAIALDARCADAYSNRGLLLQIMHRPEEALADHHQAIACKPGHPEFFFNRGSAWQDLRQLDQAIGDYAQAVALKPDYPQAHWNLSLCSLQNGDFETGWREHEWRWRCTFLDSFKNQAQFNQPQWRGVEDLHGKTIVLHSEQGLGDALQFCRYAALFEPLGAKVILQAPPSLLPLLNCMVHERLQLVANLTALPPFDYHCPLMSLPLAFKTSVNTIPFAGGYLQSDPVKRKAWEVLLNEKSAANAPTSHSHKPRIGLVWSGNPQHQNDLNRSLSLAQFMSLVPESLRRKFQFVCLQNEVRQGDQAALTAHPALWHFEPLLKDFSDTAALCDVMDHIVSVDTSVAHLAGALGKPLSILLPHNADWRWIQGRDDSPWYAQAGVYQQSHRGNWAPVFEKMWKKIDDALTSR